MEREIRYEGPAARGPRASAPLLRDLLDVLVEGTRRVLRLQVEGRSTARGTQPKWLEEAVQFDVVGFRAGSTAIVVDAPPLAELVPGMFAQGQPFALGDGDDRSALDLLEQSLEDVFAERRDSDLYDAAVVDTFGDLKRLFDRGVDRLEIRGGRGVQIERDGIATIQRLRKSIPDSRRVRVSGKLETIRHSDRMFTLLLDDKVVRCIADDGVSAETLAALFGKPVVVSGAAHFRPSGALLRIEANAVEIAGADAPVWAQVPTPTVISVDSRLLRQPQTLSSGLGAIFGQWPGDESDEEIQEALERVS